MSAADTQLSDNSQIFEILSFNCIEGYNAEIGVDSYYPH